MTKQLEAVEALRDAVQAHSVIGATYRVQDEPQVGVAWLHINFGDAEVLVSRGKSPVYIITAYKLEAQRYVIGERRMGEAADLFSAEIFVLATINAIAEGRF